MPTPFGAVDCRYAYATSPDHGALGHSSHRAPCNPGALGGALTLDNTKMTKYLIYGTVTAGKFLGTVEAESEDEAIEKAWDLDTACVCLCHRCASEAEDAQITDITVEQDS